MAKTFMLAAAIGTLILAHAVTGAAQEAASPATFVAAPLRIGSGDLIELTVYDNPDLTGHFRVDEKGDVTIPLLGPVHVEGETAAEAGTTIEQQYVAAQILKAPTAHATVFISEYATQGILVNGEARNPGLYPALGVRTLNDVITAAGGVLPTASSKVIITRKTDPANPITVEYNPDALSPVVPRVQIFPGDTITIPVAGSVYVLGGVSKPGIYILEGLHTLTVEKAMALAGGSTHGATPNHAHIVRTLDNGKKEDILFNVGEIYRGRASDLALKDGDILYIPISNAKLAIEQGIASAIGMGTAVATYRLAYR